MPLESPRASSRVSGILCFSGRGSVRGSELMVSSLSIQVEKLRKRMRVVESRVNDSKLGEKLFFFARAAVRGVFLSWGRS